MLAHNQETGTTGSYTVTDVLVHLDPAQLQLTIDGELITTTPEHPFYVLLRGWVAAIALREGDQVRQLDGDYGMVWAVAVETAPQQMYNLTVAGAHTFFVGDGEWLVHNCKNKKVIVIGENMARVREVTRQLRQAGIDARWYQAWRIDPWDESLSMARNTRWINTKQAQGYTIVDIGFDVDRTIDLDRTNPFYPMEWRATRDNPNLIRVDWPGSNGRWKVEVSQIVERILGL